MTAFITIKPDFLIDHIYYVSFCNLFSVNGCFLCILEICASFIYIFSVAGSKNHIIHL